jgi:hypothetical protein
VSENRLSQHHPHHRNDRASRLHQPALQFCLQLMHPVRNYIATMDTSPPRALLSPSPEAPSPPIAMPLPPEAVYGSREELYTSIQAWAAQYSYAFRIGRSNRIHNTPRLKIFYNCDRCGLPPPQNHPQNYVQARKRQTTTRKTGCQFSVVAIEHTNIQWELRYRPGVEYSLHNHPPSQSISSHPAHRKLAQAEINQARALHNIGKSNSI